LGLFHKHSPAAQKAQRLRREGVRVVDGVVERFPELRFRDFKSQRPLARLIELQAKLADRVRLDPYHGVPSLVAGLDVSYAGKGLAVGACAVVETASGRVAWSTTCRQAAALPYIPSLLTFREVPLLLSLFETARQAVPELDLFLVDGNGILHPRGAGVAACFGVLADVPTIGVAKSLLCGQVAADAASINGRPAIAVDGKVVGAVLARSATAHRLYVSPGQRIDLPSAVRLAALLDFGHRLPEPLYWADRMSRAEAQRESLIDSPL
jgi:deoxyribonuclease V